MNYTDNETGLDTCLPGSNRYYKKTRCRYIPFPPTILPKSWEPRDSGFENLERKRRAAPTSIEETCAYGNLSQTIMFWAQGHDVQSSVSAHEGIDATPLMWAALRGHTHVVRFLVDQGVDVNAGNSQGHSALLWGITGIHYDIVRFLLDHGADPTLQDKQGYNAYFMAVQSSNLPLVLIICETHPIDVQIRDNEGHSLLHWAAYTNSLVICQFLIEECFMEMDVLDSNGRTPLIWAAREGYADIVEYLLSCGARTEVSDMDGYTALQYALHRNHREAAYSLTQHPSARRNGVTASVDGDCSLGRSVRGLYVSVYAQRRRGTLKMILGEPLFALMSFFGIAHVVFSYVILKFIPPLFSHMTFGAFFFKNMLWMMIVGYPIQGGRPEPTYLQKIGLSNSFAESTRGIWLFRNRDAACFLALMSFLMVQQYAWAKMGLTPLLLFYPEEMVAIRRSNNESVYASSASAWYGNFFNNKAELEQAVMNFLLFVIVVSAMFCKFFSMRSVHDTLGTTLKTSPVWPILKQRAYRWLHPRILFVERNVVLPLRAFYCYERDVIMHCFDGYSIVLDCPIAESNHVWFFVFVNSFAFLQWATFFWGWEQTNELLQCPKHESLLEWFFWSLWNLLVHGLPCRDSAYIVGDWGSLQGLLRYILPSEANYLGVWLLQYSLVASLMATFVAMRQWRVAASGATRMELANPTATGSNGGLVSIFPPTLSTAAPWLPPEGYTEGLGMIPSGNTVVHAAVEKRWSRCIYATSSFCIVNVLAFLTGFAGRRWRGAMSVSPSNGPLFSISPMNGYSL